MNISQPNINWKYIGDSVPYYESLGYKYTEVPWYVSDTSINLTMPAELTAIRCVIPHKDSHAQYSYPLVGSAEQSFIELRRQNLLFDGKYVAVSPCFRNEANGRLHQTCFMKTEIIDISQFTQSIREVEGMAQQALAYFRSLEGGQKSEIVTTKDGYDINLNGIEIGSYGRRRFYSTELHMTWIYGTGIAEPRFSVAASAGR